MRLVTMRGDAPNILLGLVSGRASPKHFKNECPLVGL